MDVQGKIDELKQQGFVNTGQLLRSPQQTDELAELTRRVCAQLSPDHPHYLGEKSGGAGMRGLPQHHPRIAELLDQVVSNPDTQRVLRTVLGPDYKIWQIDYRRSAPGDKGLALHQDARGQLNICILLSDNEHGEGATIFLPGSHLVPETVKDLRIAIPVAVMPKLERRLCTPLTGKAGDIAFFFNRTWHGRFSNTSSESYDVILVGFFPAGAHMGFPPPYVDWSREFLNSIRGTELGRLMDVSVGAERQSDGRYKILASDKGATADVPFALAIETQSGRQTASVIFLRAISAVMRPLVGLARVARKIRR